MSNDGLRIPIRINATSDAGIHEVQVKGRSVTQHRVTVSSDYLRELGLESCTPNRVLEEAFAFLLERESNTSILTKFDLRDIERYFPEFRREIVRRLQR